MFLYASVIIFLNMFDLEYKPKGECINIIHSSGVTKHSWIKELRELKV